MVLLPTGVLYMNELSFAMQTEAVYMKRFCIVNHVYTETSPGPGLNMLQNGEILDICYISIFQSILQAHFALEVCAQFQPYYNPSKPFYSQIIEHIQHSLWISYNILRGEIWYGVRLSFSNAHLHGV